MDDKNKSPDNQTAAAQSGEGASLESSTPETGTNEAATPVSDSASGAPAAGENQPTKQPENKKKFSPGAILQHLNVYLLAFVFLFAVGGVITAVLYLKANQQNTGSNTPSTNSQNLSAQALQQLANSGTTIGDSKQTLNIQSNSVFQGSVLVRGNLEVAGTVKTGGTLALTGLSVTGSSSFGQLQAKGLSVQGNTGIQGQLSAQSLSIAGGGNFGSALTAPTIATNSLQLNGDLSLTHHINTGGGIPGAGRGSALGGGGSVSISGSDTAGTVNINTGSGASAGCFATINFTRSFGGAPHVVVTPVGAAAGSLQYYVNRSSSSFSVCTANSPPSGASFGFDYIVLD